jgi:hypothetical protein
MEKTPPSKIQPSPSLGTHYRVFWAELGEEVTDYYALVHAVDEMAAYRWAMSNEGQRWLTNTREDKRREGGCGEANPG